MSEEEENSAQQPQQPKKVPARTSEAPPKKYNPSPKK